MLLGTRNEFQNRFAHPISKGQFQNSDAKDVSVMKERSFILYSLLDGIVQVSTVQIELFPRDALVQPRIFRFSAVRLQRAETVFAPEARIRFADRVVRSSRGVVRALYRKSFTNVAEDGQGERYQVVG